MDRRTLDNRIRLVFLADIVSTLITNHVGWMLPLG